MKKLSNDTLEVCNIIEEQEHKIEFLAEMMTCEGAGLDVNKSGFYYIMMDIKHCLETAGDKLR
jgi:hypothetical protein